jgi:hypothetical protein
MTATSVLATWTAVAAMQNASAVKSGIIMRRVMSRER